MMSGFCNPVMYIFDEAEMKEGRLVGAYPVPYSDLLHRSDAARAEMTQKGEPLEFGHTLEDQIGGQIRAGFLIAGFYEDNGSDPAIDRHFPAFIATLAQKP